MNANDCRVMRLEIDQSELGQRLSERAEAHLAVCGSCAAFRVERTRLRELVGSLNPVSAPADFDIRLRARLAQERDRQPRQPFIFRFAISTPAIAVAAVIVMAVGSMVWIGNRSRPAPTAATNIQRPGTTTSAPTVNVAVENPPSNSPALDNNIAANPRPLFSRRAGTKPANLAAGTAVSSDFNVSRAQSYRLSPDRVGEVSLTAPLNPMVVSMYDENGSKRQILLPPISFGAQRFTDSRATVGMRNTRDW